MTANPKLHVIQASCCRVRVKRYLSDFSLSLTVQDLFQFPAKSPSALTGLVVWSVCLLSPRFNCPTLVPTVISIMLLPQVLPYSRPPAMFLQLLCQASVPRCQAQTRSRCCWQHLTASRTKLIQPSNSCFRGRLARFGSFGRRRMGQLEVCTASLKYSSALMENLIWSPLTRMCHTWVTLFNAETYLQA